MAELFGKKYTNRTRFTRMCIGEAVFSLMDKKSYEEIRVSDIVKRAGVSRMTFYHYYEQKEDALADYFHEIVNGYVRERSEILKKGGKFHDPGSIEHALKYFDQYACLYPEACRCAFVSYHIGSYELFYDGTDSTGL